MLTLALAMLATQAVHRINTVQTAAGTIAATGVSQTVLPIDADRAYLMCQNPSTASASILIDFGRPAGVGSIELTPGGTVTFMARAVPTTTVTVSGPAGAAYLCKSGGN